MEKLGNDRKVKTRSIKMKEGNMTGKERKGKMENLGRELKLKKEEKEGRNRKEKE